MPFPMPSDVESLQVEFITWALRRRGALDYRTRVATYSTRQLEGGVHYCVAQLMLQYETLDGTPVASGDLAILVFGFFALIFFFFSRVLPVFLLLIVVVNLRNAVE
jgi:hypothetical protein